MANDRQQFRTAENRWEQLHDQRLHSLPPHLGTVAILCSFITNVYGKMPDGFHPNDHDAEVELFRTEACALADRFTRDRKRAEVILDASIADVLAVLQDPVFSDVITIGHGNLSGFYARHTSNGNLIDWREVAANTSHLKLGVFVQRHCGGMPRGLSVPYGVFATHDHRNVYAAIGYNFDPADLDHPDNSLLSAVSPTPRISLDFIKANYSSRTNKAS